MTLRDPVLVRAHDSSSSPRRRRSTSTGSARSRSAGPASSIVTFTPTTLSSDAKGVRDITRKFIRTLEGLGHLDGTDMDEQDCESDERHDINEVEQVLRSAIQANAHGNGVSNGAAVVPGRRTIPRPANLPPKRIDWEIPRKALHSSIGFFTLYLYISENDVARVVFILWSALAIIVPADVLRLRHPPFERIYERCLGFLMRESEKKSSNGVIWYILGVNFALTFYPHDVATVAILILSWADTSASTFGRLWGYKTPRLPARTPVLRLPLAPRKSLAGFIAASVTGALIAFGFWGWVAPLRHGGADLTWSWDAGVRSSSSSLFATLGLSWPGLGSSGGWMGLTAIGVISGLVSGVAEALDLGSLDDNLTLPIISGGCILGFLKVLGQLSG